MLTLNKSNGEIKVDEYIFNANTTALELESLSTKYVVKSHTTNTGSNFYNILDLDSGESALQFIFRDNKLKTINIGLGTNYNFPPFIITEHEKKILKKKLKNLGGENNYPWGSVEYNEDIKGGSISIVVKYKSL